MKNFKYRLTPPRALLFIVLLTSGIWQIASYGWEASRPGNIWLALVLFVALLGSIVLRFYLGRKNKE